MKAVLYNDFKLVRNTALPLVIVIGAILALSVVITGEKSEQFFIQWAFIMIFTLRAQVAFGDNFKDFQKFMTMPISIEDYSLAKIIKNLIIFVITSLVLLMGLILSNEEDKNIIIDIYTSLFIGLDFMALSLSHIVFTRYQRGSIVFLWALFWIIFGAGLAFIYSSFYESFTIYRPIFIGVSIIICILSFKLDYKYSTKYLRERGIL